MQKEIIPLHKLQDHALVVSESFQIKGTSSLTEKSCELSHSSVSHIEQECQESLIQGKIYI